MRTHASGHLQDFSEEFLDRLRLLSPDNEFVRTRFKISGFETDSYYPDRRGIPCCPKLVHTSY